MPGGDIGMQLNYADGKYLVGFHVSKIEGNNSTQFGHERVKLNDSNVKLVSCNSKVKIMQ